MAPMSSRTLLETKDAVILRDLGQELDRFTPDRIFQKIGLHRESWSYEPFAYIQDQSGGPLPEAQQGNRLFPTIDAFLSGPWPV